MKSLYYSLSALLLFSFSTILTLNTTALAQPDREIFNLVPVLTLEPNSGFVGDSVTVKGRSFKQRTEFGPTKIFFDGKERDDGFLKINQ